MRRTILGAPGRSKVFEDGDDPLWECAARSWKPLPDDSDQNTRFSIPVISDLNLKMYTLFKTLWGEVISATQRTELRRLPPTYFQVSSFDCIFFFICYLILSLFCFLHTVKSDSHISRGGSERLLQQFGKKALCPTHFGQDCSTV